MSGDWRDLGRYPEPVEFTAPRRSSVLLTALGVILAVVSGLLVGMPASPSGRSGGMAWVGWVGLVLFVPATLYGLYRTVRPRVALRLDADGLVDTSSPSAVGRVAWGDVIEAAAFQLASARLVGVLVRDPEAVLARLDPVKRAVASANRGLADTPVWINALGLPAEDVALLINDYRESWAVAHGGPQ